MATITKQYHYPQKYFLEGEALQHFAIKGRTYKRWKDEGTLIPGRYRVKGTNYYVIKPEEFHQWLIETKLEPATNLNKIHNGRHVSRDQKSLKGGKLTRDDVSGAVGVLSSPSFTPDTNKSNGLAT